MTLYLLPGVGCDARLFSRLDLGGLEVKVLEWPAFPKGCTLAQLAAQMQPQVDASRPHVLAGVSMGGMVAQELALLTQPRKVILISTWTGPQEWPLYVRLAKTMNLPKLITDASMRLTWPVKAILGRRDKTTDRLLFDMAVKQGGAKIRHGVQAVLRWNGANWKGAVVRVHGDGDHVIPMRFPVEHVVPGGPHIMVLVRAAEVSAILRAEAAG